MLFSKVIETLILNDVKSATYYESPKLIVRATWRTKPRANNRREEIVVTYGAPNYLEAKFAKLCKKAGEPFPVRKIQLRAWPKKRKPKTAQK